MKTSRNADETAPTCAACKTTLLRNGNCPGDACRAARFLDRASAAATARINDAAPPRFAPRSPLRDDPHFDAARGPGIGRTISRNHKGAA